MKMGTPFVRSRFAPDTADRSCFVVSPAVDPVDICVGAARSSISIIGPFLFLVMSLRMKSVQSFLSFAKTRYIMYVCSRLEKSCLRRKPFEKLSQYVDSTRAVPDSWISG